MAVDDQNKTDKEKAKELGEKWLEQERAFDDEKQAEYLAKKWEEQNIVVHPKGSNIKVGPVKANQWPWEASLSDQLGDRQ